MKLTDEQLFALIKSAECGRNYHDYQEQQCRYQAKEKTFIETLMDGKVLVDRWGNVTEIIVFNPENKQIVDNALKNYASSTCNPNITYDGSCFWGADIEYSNVVPKNQILFLSNLDRLDELLNPNFYTSTYDESIDEGHAVAIIPLPKKR